MAMFMLTLDEPLGASDAEWNSYEQKRDVWVAATLKAQGLKEIRFYVNPHETSPTVLGCYEFDSLDSIHHMISSDDFKRIMREMRQNGVSNIRFRVLENSPVMPEPLRP